MLLAIVGLSNENTEFQRFDAVASAANLGFRKRSIPYDPRCHCD
jgi:hypothetical protein